jgi:hypothetical protein
MSSHQHEQHSALQQCLLNAQRTNLRPELTKM